MDISISPIGKVQSKYKKPKDLIFACEKGLKTKTYSKIIVKKKYSQGLKGLNKFSHLWVIFFLHKANKLELITHPGPPTETDLPQVGVFASRSQYRPNHLALRLVKLKSVKENIIYTEGLDAINGTNVIDIKPYVKGFDRPDKYKIANWYNWFEK